MRAAAAVAQIGSDAKDAVPALQEVFLKKGQGNYTFYAESLAKIGKAALPVFEAALKDERPEVRNTAIQFVGKIGSEAVPLMVDALGSKDVVIRRLAAQALNPMRVGDKMVVLGLAYGLKDEDHQVRMSCLHALQALGPVAKLAAPHLQTALADTNHEIRQTTFHTLQSMGENPLPGLRKALDSKDEKIRINTASLMMVTGVDQNTARPILVDGLKNEDATLRIQCAHSLAMARQEMGKTLPILVEGLKNKSAGVRQQSAQGLQVLSQHAATSDVPGGDPTKAQPPAAQPGAVKH